MKFQPYALHGSAVPVGDCDHGRERYAVRAGDSGGRIIADDWGLNLSQADRLARELQRAFELGRHWKAEA